MDDFRQTPRGFWYPTKVSRVIRHNSPSAPEKIRPQTTMYFFLGFPADMPDELFKADSDFREGK
jgi:hypothetical protein